MRRLTARHTYITIAIEDTNGQRTYVLLVKKVGPITLI